MYDRENKFRGGGAGGEERAGGRAGRGAGRRGASPRLRGGSGRRSLFRRCRRGCAEPPPVRGLARRSEPDPAVGRIPVSVFYPGHHHGDRVYPAGDFPLRGEQLSADGHVSPVRAVFPGVQGETYVGREPALQLECGDGREFFGALRLLSGEPLKLADCPVSAGLCHRIYVLHGGGEDRPLRPFHGLVSAQPQPPHGHRSRRVRHLLCAIGLPGGLQLEYHVAGLHHPAARHRARCGAAGK